MAKSAPIAAVVAMLAALALAGPATAGRAIYSYDSVTPVTVTMTENGITLILDKSFMNVRVLQLAETLDVGEADLRPASESALGASLSALIGPDAHEHDLYEVLPKGDGRALVAALCPGADRGWLAFGLVKLGRDLRIRALGRDPATGKARLCRTLDYAFHGEWKTPPIDLPQPDRSDPFNDAPATLRF
jgi:hypothetical protein